MVYYFYHLELSPKAQVIDPWECEVVHIEPSLVYLARIYVLAEKYFIEGLKATVMASFRESLSRDLEHHELIEACHIIFKKTVEPSGEKGLKATVATCLALELEKVKKSEMYDKLFQEISERDPQAPISVYPSLWPLWHHQMVGLEGQGIEGQGASHSGPYRTFQAMILLLLEIIEE
jgi:hypothetical protein